jgi:hypothetical protein
MITKRGIPKDDVTLRRFDSAIASIEFKAEK